MTTFQVLLLKLLYEAAAYDHEGEAWRILKKLDPQRENARQILTSEVQLMQAPPGFWMKLGIAPSERLAVIRDFHKWLRGLGVRTL